MSDGAKKHDLGIRRVAADLLDNNLEAILSRWEDEVRRNIPAARNQEKLLLRDHLLPYLTSLSEMLRETSVMSARERSHPDEDFDASPNEIHGRLRATLPGYSIEEVINEYITLRQIVTDYIEHEGLLSQEVLEVICAVNEKAIMHAATHFSTSLQTLRQRAVSMLMHDIRNPLNVVSITAELVKVKSENLAGNMDTILANAAKIDKMVTELLDAVKLQAGEGLELQFAQCDLCHTVAVAAEGANLAYPDRIEVRVPEQPAEGLFDSSGIARAVENLVSNAIKYGDSEEKVLLELSVSEDSFKISVHNWGHPIEERDQATIFVTFSRSQDPEKNFREKGWGLGLAYVKAVAEGHGGEVQVESSEEQGTTFSIILPRNAGGNAEENQEPDSRA